MRHLRDRRPIGAAVGVAGAAPGRSARITRCRPRRTSGRIALSLPATSEKPSYGTPGFRVKDKLFARVREEGDVLVVSCADLLAAEPEVLFSTPHYDGHASVLVRLDVVDRDLLTELITDSWLVRAPAKLAAELDTGG